MGRDTIVDAQGGTLLLAAGLAPGELTAQRLGDDLFLGIQHSRDGARIEGYFGSTQNWQLTDAGGNTQSLASLVATLPEPARSGSTAQAFTDFRG